MADELSEIILERTFETRDAEGNTGTIALRIGKPYQLTESGSSLKWRCPYQIIGVGSGKIKEGPGADAIDALLISLYIANELLKSYSRSYRTKITWLGEDGFGFHHLAQIETLDTDSFEDDNDSLFKQAFVEFFRDMDRLKGRE